MQARTQYIRGSIYDMNGSGGSMGVRLLIPVERVLDQHVSASAMRTQCLSECHFLPSDDLTGSLVAKKQPFRPIMASRSARPPSCLAAMVRQHKLSARQALRRLVPLQSA